MMKNQLLLLVLWQGPVLNCVAALLVNTDKGMEMFTELYRAGYRLQTEGRKELKFGEG